MRVLLLIIALLLPSFVRGATGTPGITTKVIYVNNGGNLTAAKNAANAGDTIEVASGASLVGGTNMLKPGLNWHFWGQGTLIVTNKDTTQRCAMFDDNGVPSTNFIYAPGWNFIYSNANGTMTLNKGMVLQVSNSASDIKFIAKSARIGIDDAVIDHAAIRIFNARRVVLDVDEVRGDTDLSGDDGYYGLVWGDGSVTARIPYLTGERSGLFITGSTVSTNTLNLYSDTIQAFAEPAIGIHSSVPITKRLFVTVNTLVGRGNPTAALDQNGGWLTLNMGSVSNTSYQVDSNMGWSAAMRVGGGRLTLNAEQIYSPRRALFVHLLAVVDLNIKEVTTAETNTYDAVTISNVVGVINIGRLNSPTGRGVYVGGTNAVILTANIKSTGTGDTNEPIFLDGTGVSLKNCVLDAPATSFAVKATTTNQPLVMGTISMNRPATNVLFVGGIAQTNTAFVVP